jgi:uncharacterized protein YajQ (UPF0234 family)
LISFPVNKVEVRNAVEQANKEVSTRYDFKGSDSRIEQTDKDITLYADAEFQLDQVNDILVSKLSKRNVDVRSLEYGKLEKVSGNKVKKLTVKEGWKPKWPRRSSASSRMPSSKVQASIQGEAVRVSGAKRDLLGMHCPAAQGDCRRQGKRRAAAVQQLPRLSPFSPCKTGPLWPVLLLQASLLQYGPC